MTAMAFNPIHGTAPNGSDSDRRASRPIIGIDCCNKDTDHGCCQCRGNASGFWLLPNPYICTFYMQTESWLLRMPCCDWVWSTQSGNIDGSRQGLLQSFWNSSNPVPGKTLTSRFLNTLRSTRLMRWVLLLLNLAHGFGNSRKDWIVEWMDSNALPGKWMITQVHG